MNQRLTLPRMLLLAASLCGVLWSAAGAESTRPTSIKVVMDDNYPPFIFRDSAGGLQGILPDQWRLWERKTGIRAEISAMDWGEAMRRMQAGEFDVIDTIFKTDERATWLDFTPPYAKLEVPIFFDKEISGITTAASLKGFAVGVKSGDDAIDLLREHGIDTLLPFNSYESIIRAAKERKITVFVADAPPALYLLHKFGIRSQYRQSAPLNVGEFHRAVKKGDCELLRVVADGFSRISPEEFKKIDTTWYGASLADGHMLRYFLIAGGGLSLILLILLAWNRLLIRAVDTRTTELKASEELFRTLTTMAQAGIYLADTKGNCQYANPSWCEMAGLSLQEALGDGWMKGLHPEDRESVLSNWKQMVAAEGHWGIEYRFQTRDGKTTWVYGVATPQRNASGKIVRYVGINMDITDRKRVEAELLRAKTEAEAANRAKSQFLANMSHELRTPLNPIIGFSDMLEQAPNLTDEQRKWLGIVRQRGLDLLALISDILDLARVEAGKIAMDTQPMSLRLTLKDMMASIKPAAAKKGLELESHVEPELPDEICADGLRLRQILLNLLSNAIKFTPEGCVAMRVERADANRLTRPLADGETALLFSVRDTGIGIPAEKQAIIFDAFKQADISHAVEYGGAGLGLAIAWNLVGLMDGTLWVKSVEGRGSEFFFTAIVGVHEGIASPVPKDTTMATRPRQPLRLLVVDDDPSSRLLVETLARQRGDEIRSVQDGTEALSLLDVEMFDVVLMDIRMPGMDGVAATRAIRESDRQTGRHTVVVALTAHALVADREHFLAAGMDGYLAKPLKQETLFHAIDAAATRGGS